MAHAKFLSESRHPQVVGSFGSFNDLRDSEVGNLRNSCDLMEIRLDLLAAEGGPPHAESWAHLSDVPILFTARRIEEGGALPLDDAQRMKLLREVLADATMVDIEVASIGGMGALLEELARREIPWVASFHDFEKLPDTQVLLDAAKAAKDAGAAVFKTAARLSGPADLARLAEFQLADHGIPVATMGMGPLAAVSRLLCAQCGSLLNYGYIGTTPTAPGQWDSLSLKRAIAKLPPLRG